METLKTLPEFIDGVEKARKAKKSIEIAKEELLKAREIRVDKLLKKKEEIEQTINSYEKKLKELSKQLKKDCSQNGHKMVLISQRRISNKRGTHSFINPGYEYKVTYKCAVCGYTTTCKGKMVLTRPNCSLSEAQKEILGAYEKEKNLYEKVLMESKQELKEIENEITQICLFFGHEVIQCDDFTQYKCLCCGKTFYMGRYSSQEKDINNFMKIPRELIKV